MNDVLEPSEFGKILILMILGFIFIGLGYTVNRLLKKPNPNPLKNSNYECGEEPIGPARVAFNNRFYIIAIVFLLFEVELLFLFPWATVFADANLLLQYPNWGLYNMIEMGFFVVMLLLGLAFVWNKGALQWKMPKMNPRSSHSKIPSELYEAINQKTYKVVGKPIETIDHV
jgi:NADH-quinone oxidoreductase subunit A